MWGKVRTVTTFFLFAGGLFVLWLAGDGFRSGVMYGQAADVDRNRSPQIFKFIGFTYCAIGILALGAVAYRILS